MLPLHKILENVIYFIETGSRSVFASDRGRWGRFMDYEEAQRNFFGEGLRGCLLS